VIPLKRTLIIAVLMTLAAVWAPANLRAEEGEGRFKFGGSMRGRFELFRFSEDESGDKKDTRGRIRYRFRFDGKITLNTHANFNFRFVSGTDSRSGNTTLGDPVDFGPATMSIRYAMLVLTPWDDAKLPDDKGFLAFHFGRVKNPYVWKQYSQDKMIWDNDISLAGMSAVFGHDLGEKSKVFLNTGYYVIDEQSSGSKDPYMAPVQLGLTTARGKFDTGIRGSYFYFNELDSKFVQRGVNSKLDDESVTSSGGNILDGLTGSPYGGKLEVVETQAFFGFKLRSIPITFSGGYSKNISAKASEIYPGVGEEAIAYNAGIEGGDRKKNIKLGAAWYHIEANAFPSQFIDSDFLDGHTNRQGLFLFFQKQVLKNTDFNTQLFASDAIETESIPDDEDSVVGSERVRLQVDLMYHF
jgi:hypothetical protein